MTNSPPNQQYQQNLQYSHYRGQYQGENVKFQKNAVSNADYALYQQEKQRKKRKSQLVANRLVDSFVGLLLLVVAMALYLFIVYSGGLLTLPTAGLISGGVAVIAGIMTSAHYSRKKGWRSSSTGQRLTTIGAIVTMLFSVQCLINPLIMVGILMFPITEGWLDGLFTLSQVNQDDLETLISVPSLMLSLLLSFLAGIDLGRLISFRTIKIDELENAPAFVDDNTVIYHGKED